MTFTMLGWAVVHSLWLCTFLAGLTALVLSTLPDNRARARHALAYSSLILMVLLPFGFALAPADLLGEGVRQPLVRGVEEAIGIATILETRAIIVPAAAALWMAGLILYGLRIAGEWRRARRLSCLDLDDAGEPVRAAVRELRTRLAVRTDVGVHRSRLATVPMVLGWLRPLILLPAGTADSLAPPQLRAVLAHELAHVRRRDYLANLVQMAAETMLFHHPAARWISRRIRIEREYCCDDVAVSVGEDPADYARALAALDDARDDCRMAVAAVSGTLLDRIQRIAGHPRPVLTPIRGIAAFVMTSFVAAIILAMSTVVPPELPLDVKLRSKVPGAGGQPPARGVSLPRTPQR